MAWKLVLCVAAVGLAYLILAGVVLPSRLRSAGRHVGVELTFASLHSLHPGRIVLENPELRASGWGLKAQQAVATLTGILPFGEEWRVERAHATGVFFERAGKWRTGPFAVNLEPAQNGSAGRVSVLGEDVRSRVGDWSLQADIRASGRLENSNAAGEVRLSDATMTLFDFELAPLTPSEYPSASPPHPPAGPRLRAHLQLENAAFSPGRGVTASGELTLEGSDAGIWLDLAAAEGALRWMLSDIGGKPFDARGLVDVRGETVTLEQVEMEIGHTRVRGELHGNGDGMHGALLVSRGASSVGVTISEGGIATHVMPGPDWLALELVKLAVDGSPRH